jgi:hypothetical protein
MAPGTANAKKDVEGSFGKENITNAAPSEAMSEVARPAKAAYDKGNPSQSRDLALAALKTPGLTNLQKADLYWVLGLAEQALGKNAEAERAVRESARLRGGR